MPKISTDLIQDKANYLNYALQIVLKEYKNISLNQALQIVADDYLFCSLRTVQRLYKSTL